MQRVRAEEERTGRTTRKLWCILCSGALMRIPVFVSCPSTLSSTQERSRALILEELAAFGLEPRAIGRSDYPIDFPLREVAILCRHCSGGVILGFEQFCADSGAWKKDTPEAKVVKGSVSFPSPWNNMEGAILFALGLPILVFREPCIRSEEHTS